MIVPSIWIFSRVPCFWEKSLVLINTVSARSRRVLVSYSLHNRQHLEVTLLVHERSILIGIVFVVKAWGSVISLAFQVDELIGYVK